MRLLLFVLLLCSGISLTAQECTFDWQYYRTVNIETSNVTYSRPYQVRIPLQTADLIADGKLRADLADLRVFNATCDPVPFVALPEPGTDSITIWVKLAGDNINTTMLQLYYGKESAASAMNGDSVFTFFDDFSSGVIDPEKWETVGEFARFDVTDGVASYASTSANPGARFKFARTKASFNDEVASQVFQYRGSVNNANGFGFSSSAAELDRYLFRQSGFGFDTLNLVAVMTDTLSNGFGLITDYPLLRFPRNEFSTFEIYTQTSGDNLTVNNFANLDNGGNNDTDQSLGTLVMPRHHFIMSSFSPNFPIELDYVFVRSTDADDLFDVPTIVTLDEELQAVSNSLPPLLTASSVKIFPNPATDRVRLEVDADFAFRIELSDALGRSYHPNGTNNDLRNGASLNLAGLPRGLYTVRLLRASDGRWLQTSKLLLQ